MTKTVSGDMDIEDYVREQVLQPGVCIDPQRIFEAHRKVIEAIQDKTLPTIVRKQETKGPRSLRAQTIDFEGCSRKVVFSDNSPPIWLFHILFSTESLVDIGKAIREKKIPIAHLPNPTEKVFGTDWPLLLTSMKVYPQLWTAGWKLSHILPCSPRDNDILHRLEADSQNLDAYFENKMLRNLSPFNYFCSPKPRHFEMKYLDGQARGKDLGEDDLFIRWVVKILHDDTFRSFPHIQDEFRTFLRMAGEFEIPSQKDLQHRRVWISRRAGKNTEAKGVAASPGPLPEVLLGRKCYVVHQTVDREMFGEILVAPLGQNWTNMAKLKPGDFVAHKRNGRIRAISTVESMDRHDSRLDGYRAAMEILGAGTVDLRYRGKHLTKDHEDREFVVVLLRTHARNLDIPLLSPARNARPYLFRLKAENLALEIELIKVIESLGFAFDDIDDGSDDD